MINFLIVEKGLVISLFLFLCTKSRKATLCVDFLAYWSFFRIKSFKVPIIAYICGIYKFMYAKNAFSAALKRLSVMEK